MHYPTDESAKQVVVCCPYCDSHDTEFFSLFGQQLLTMQYSCNNCHTPFEYVKGDEMFNAYATRKEGQA